MTTKITIQEYLSQKSITYRESGQELITKCIFNDCDRDSGESEAHLYFNKDTSQYECKKCGEKGNLITLQKHFGDKTTTQRSSSYRGPRFTDELVQKCHEQLPERIRTYLNERGIIDGVINSYKIGYGTFYGKNYITIPIMDDDGYKFFKLRQDPKDGNSKITYPKGAEAQLFGMYAPSEEKQIICEGELDALALI
jgi:DNA primase